MSYAEKAAKIRKAIDLALSYLDDFEAEVVTDLFNPWKTNTEYSAGDRCKHNGLLYRCVQNHISQNNWTPDQTPALWTRTSIDEWPEWIQPIGSQDAYSNGDKVSYNGHHYISIIDANVWAPDQYGWSLAE